MAQIYHIPRQFVQPPPPNHRAALLAVCDLIAKQRYGVPSALMLDIERRELIIGYLGDLWEELDQLPVVGMVS
jgi:hypothetical protein